MFEKFFQTIYTIEGADGTGKDTIIDILHKKYPNSYIVRFPDRTNETGKVINNILTKKAPFPHPLAFQSLMCLNKVETLTNIDRNNKIDPEIFLFCRYYESAYVYGLNDGIPISLSQDLNSILPKSEKTFILDGKKYRADGEHYEQTEVQDNIAKNYREIAIKLHWDIINNDRTLDEISEDISERIKNHLYYLKY